MSSALFPKASADKKPIKVLITGAAGQIGYSLIPNIASGRVFGFDQPIILHLLDIPQSEKPLRGVEMEITDCAFPLLQKVVATVKGEEGFEGVQYAFLVGGFPRLKGMNRSDLLAKNAPIFIEQGRLLDKYADKNVKVLVVANPANTNCMIAAVNAPSIPKENFSCLTRLDHNRSRGQIAGHLHISPAEVRNAIIWGNHSNTMVVDSRQVELGNGEALPKDDFFNTTMVPLVQNRGAAIIEYMGKSSAMSAAHAAAEHMRDWAIGTPEKEFVSMGIFTDGSAYDIPAGIVYSFPVRCSNGKWEIVRDLNIDQETASNMKKTCDELVKEREDYEKYVASQASQQ